MLPGCPHVLIRALLSGRRARAGALCPGTARRLVYSPRVPSTYAALRIGPFLCALAVAVSGVGCQGPDPDPYVEPRRLEPYDGGAPPDGGVGVDTPKALSACVGERNPFMIEPPAADFERLDYAFMLRGNGLRSVSGTVLRARPVSDPAVIARALLLGDGAFLGVDCDIHQGNNSFGWRGRECKTTPGTLWNTFVVEPENLGNYAWLVDDGTRVRITGYEIETFEDREAGNRSWTDGGDDGLTGQVSLWLTDICLEDAP